MDDWVDSMEERNAYEKIVGILECVAEKGYNKKVKEISEMVSINRTSVYRIVEELVKMDMLLMDPETKRITIGPKAYHIGASYLRNSSVNEEIRNILSRTAEQFHMAIGYCVASSSITQGKVLNMFEVVNYEERHLRYESGAYYPINRGVYGKTLAAFYEPRDEMERIVRSVPLTASTARSIVDPDVLLAEYEEIRRTGICYSSGENSEGYFGIGMPVRNAKSRVIGCVGAAVPLYRFEEEKKEIVERLVRECVGEIEKLYLKFD